MGNISIINTFIENKISIDIKKSLFMVLKLSKIFFKISIKRNLYFIEKLFILFYEETLKTCLIVIL